LPLPSFFDWFRASADPYVPWLLLGKGPSFARLPDVDVRGWRTFGLNHVCREARVDVAHAIDLDVLDRCGDRLLTHAGVLVMPWHPHEPDPQRPDWVPRKAVRVSPRTLGEHAAAHPILRELARDGRLLWYNLSSASDVRPDGPVVRGRHFSAVAALNLLAQAGARTVRSLGIDGGDAYGEAFADLAAVTRLVGGQRSYDLQFPEIGRTLVTTDLSYAPLGASPIRVFVGATDAQHLPVRVLEHSIRRRTPRDVQVTPLYRVGLSIPEPRDPRNRGRTPFSFQRFLIPEAAGFTGRAIYLDSDMLVFEDLQPLWDADFGDAEILGIRTQDRDPTARFSVLLMDCDRLRGWRIQDVVAGLDEGRFTYEQLLYEMNWGPRVAGGIDARWNQLDTVRAGETALLHYTDVHRQPWVSTEHPLGHLWMRELFEALDTGFITEDEIAAAAAAGHVRPSLAAQVRVRIEDPLLLPRAVRRQDLLFVEPFRLRPWAATTRAARAGLVARAAVRRAWRQSALFRMRTWVAERW
jgi:hypothetical protein